MKKRNERGLAGLSIGAGDSYSMYSMGNEITKKKIEQATKPDATRTEPELNMD